jgi:hypothetical protein
VSDLERLTQAATPGQPIILDVARNGQIVHLSVNAA